MRGNKIVFIAFIYAGLYVIINQGSNASLFLGTNNGHPRDLTITTQNFEPLLLACANKGFCASAGKISLSTVFSNNIINQPNTVRW